MQNGPNQDQSLRVTGTVLRLWYDTDCDSGPELARAAEREGSADDSERGAQP